MREKIVFFWGLVALVFVGVYFISSAPAPASKEVEQPIRFSHKKHANLRLACANCHQNVEKGAAATIPQAQFCMTCHQAPVTQNPEAEKIKEYYQAGKEIPWVRLFDLADTTFYSHRPHIKSGLECTTCHGNIPETDVIPLGFGREGIERAKGWTFPVGWTISPLVGLVWQGPAGSYGMPLMNNLCLQCHQRVETEEKMAANTTAMEDEDNHLEKKEPRRLTDCLTCHK